MTDTLITVAVTLVAVFGLGFVIALVLAGGDVGRIGLSLRARRRILTDKDFGDQVALLLTPAKEQGPAKPSGVPLRFLALLQREGRLVDFLLEDVQAYDNEQIGAAVRDIHRSCHKALKEHLALEPVIAKEEEAHVEVPAGFDPSAIRLTGNVTGNPPFAGRLRHHGWRVTQIKLAAPPQGQDELILAPAEVELP